MDNSLCEPHFFPVDTPSTISMSRFDKRRPAQESLTCTPNRHRKRNRGEITAGESQEEDNLRRELRLAKIELEESHLQHQKDFNSKELEIKSLKTDVRRLQNQTEFLIEEEKSARAALFEKEKQLIQTSHELETRLRRSESDHLSKVEELKSSLSSLQDQLESRESRWTARLGAAKQEIAALKKSIDSLNSSLTDARAVNVVESDAEPAEGPFVMSQAFDSTDALRHRLCEAEQWKRNATAELSGLKKRVLNSEALNQKVLQLQKQLARVHTGQNDSQAMSGEMSALRDRERRWMEVFKHIVSDCDDCSPEKALRCLRDLQQENVKLLSSQHSLEETLAGKQASIRDLEKRLSLSSSSLSLATQERSCASEKAAALQHKCALLQSQVDSLNALSLTYGEISSEKGILEGGGLTDGSTVEEVKASCAAELKRRAARILALESGLAASREEGERLEKKLLSSTASGAGFEEALRRVRELEAIEQTLLAEKSTLSRQLQQAERDLAVLERRLGRGEYDPTKTKILRFSAHPQAAVAKKLSLSEQHKLVEEVAKLRSIVQNDGMDVDAPSTGDDKAVESLKRRIQRLKEVFRQQTLKFREAVYLLTGYKVDMTSEGQCKLKPLYAKSAEDCLVFQRGDKEGGLQLLETGLCKSLDSRLFSYLHRCNSIPAFTATVMLHLFEQRPLSHEAK